MKSLLALLSCLPLALAAAETPNVVLILADDMGYADLSSYGSRNCRTPHIDRLAEQGVRLTQFYASAPECSPSRTALLTGRYPQRPGGLECAIGVGNAGRYDDAIRLAARHDLGLPASLSVLPSALAPRGYRSAITGKWHLGYEPKFNPLEHGFEYFIGVIGGNSDYFHHVESRDDPTRPGDPVLYRNREPYRDDRYLTHLFTDEAVGWIERMPDNAPFFLYVPYTAPHAPLQGPGDRRDTPLIGEDFNRNFPGRYPQLVAELDRGVGAIVAALERRGMADNTLVIFTSDNGATRAGENQPFRGTKSTVYEGGIRVPCIIRWPGRIAPGTTSAQPGILMDLTYSILVHTGMDIDGLRLEGMDLIGHLAAGKPETPRTLFWRYRRGSATRQAVRAGDLKLIENQEETGREVRLFDLARDPGEEHDLAAQRPEEVGRLAALLADWTREVRPVQ